MERKIGEIFEFKKDWYQCVEGRCKDCHFSEKRFLCKQFITKNFCTSGIIFKKLEKVGEPYMDGGKIMQKYKRVYREPIYFPYKELNCYNDFHRRICIEIKQNKEDMEGKTNLYEKQTPLQKLMEIYCDGRMDYNEFEKKVKELYFDKGDDSKPILKPFDLKAAKQGKPVCTRDGRKARIICFDRVDAKPILALVASTDGKGENVFDYFVSGKRIASALESDLDLMMLPEKKEGWVNVYYDNDASSHRGCRYIYDTKEQALKDAGSAYITTIKIEWEE